MRILDVGCGMKKTTDAVGIDISPETQADVVHDLNKFPWPFKNNEFDRVICNDVIEHLEHIIKVIEEIYRITAPGGTVEIRVPHFSSNNAYGDVTHKHFFSVTSFDCFTVANPTMNHYSKARFSKIRMKIYFPKMTCFVGFFANKWPEKYERYLAFIFPAGNIEFRLKPKKNI